MDLAREGEQVKMEETRWKAQKEGEEEQWRQRDGGEKGEEE